MRLLQISALAMLLGSASYASIPAIQDLSVLPKEGLVRLAEAHEGTGGHFAKTEEREEGGGGDGGGGDGGEGGDGGGEEGGGEEGGGEEGGGEEGGGEEGGGEEGGGEEGGDEKDGGPRGNNGWGNGDQDAPGRSGPRNNAENGPLGDNNGVGKNSGNSGRKP